jgi:RimJ/RimL family protein N-acetyltransferase
MRFDASANSVPADDATRPEQLRLRPFTEADDAEVTSWFSDAGALRFFAGRRLSWPLDEEQWAAIRDDPKITAWTAVLGDDPTPVAHGEMIEESSAVILFALLAIAPALRGRHLGREIMKRLVEKARERGYSFAHVFVHPDNATAIRAFRTFGFEPVSEPEAGVGLRLEFALGND